MINKGRGLIHQTRLFSSENRKLLPKNFLPKKAEFPQPFPILPLANNTFDLQYIILYIIIKMQYNLLGEPNE